MVQVDTGNDRRLGWGRSAAVLALALAVRLTYLASAEDNPTFAQPLVDARVYHELAQGLAAGEPAGPSLFWQPPFYPLFLAAVYACGGSLTAARLVQALLGAATAALAAALAARLAGRRAGLIAGAATACYGPLVFYDGELLGAGWAALWSLVLVWLLERVGRGAGRGTCALTGIVAALAVSTRPDFVPFLVAAAVWAAWRGTGDRRARAARLGVALAGFLAVAAPTAWLAARHTGHASILPTSGALNLYIGNNPRSAATVAIRPGADWDELTRLPDRHGVTRRQDRPRWFLRQVAAYAMADPAGLAAGLADKAVQFVSSRELPRNDDVYVFRSYSSLLAALVWRAGPFGFPFGVLLPLAVAGWVLAWRRLPPALALLVVLYPAAVAAVFVSGRYRAPVVPALIVVTCAGLARVPGLIRARRWRRLAAAGGAAALAVPLSILPGPFPQERTDHRAELLYLLGSAAVDRGEPDRALALLEQALARDPGQCDARNSLGVVLAGRGELERALGELRAAAACLPSSPTVRANLARVLAARGDVAAAERELLQALTRDPGRAELHYHHGVVLAGAGREQEARRAFEQALDRARAEGNPVLARRAAQRLERMPPR